MERCEECKYFKLDPKDGSKLTKAGQCRINPPTVMLLNIHTNGTVSAFPRIGISDWCGKFKQR